MLPPTLLVPISQLLRDGHHLKANHRGRPSPGMVEAYKVGQSYFVKLTINDQQSEVQIVDRSDEAARTFIKMVNKHRAKKVIEEHGQDNREVVSAGFVTNQDTVDTNEPG